MRRANTPIAVVALIGSIFGVPIPVMATSLLTPDAINAAPLEAIPPRSKISSSTGDGPMTGDTFSFKSSAAAYVVYPPPTKEFPFLSVILLPDGTVIARRFNTAEEASAYNSQMAKSLYTGGSKH